MSYNRHYSSHPYPKIDFRHHVCPVRCDLAFVLVLKNYDYDEEKSRFYLRGEWRVRCRCGHIMPRCYGFKDVRFSIDYWGQHLRYPYAPRALVSTQYPFNIRTTLHD